MMPDDPLKKWLDAADETFAQDQPVPDDLADRARAQVRRERRLVRIGGGSVTVVLMAIFAAVWWPRDLAQPPIVPSPGSVTDAGLTEEDVLALRTEMRIRRARLDSELRVARMVREHEQQQRRLAELKAVASGPDPLEEVRRHLEDTAYLMLYQAEQLSRREDGDEEARSAYRRTAELFPATRSGKIAQERLTRYQQS